MLIKKEEAREKKHAHCVVNEYDFPNKQLGFATARLTGRYPEKGKAVNTECDEMYFVISGTATVHNESGDYEIKEGDTFLFEKGRWYWIETKDLFIGIPTSPAWFPEQYKLLE